MYNVKIAHQNVRSLKNKLPDILKILNEDKIDVMCLSETWLQQDEIVPALNNFSLFRSDRITRGGGVAIFCKSNLVSRIIEIDKSEWIQPSSLEIVAVSVQEKRNKSIIIACVYRTQYLRNDVKNLQRCVDYFNNTGKSVYLVGDFNVNVRVANNSAGILLRTMENCGFKQIVDTPTRGENIIDLVFVKSNCGNSSTCSVIDRMVSDHFMQVLMLASVKVKVKEQYVLIRDYSHADWPLISSVLSSYEDEVIETGSIETMCNKLLFALVSAYERGIPIVKRAIKPENYVIKTSNKTQRFLEIRKYHDRQYQETKSNWHKAKKRIFERLVRENIKLDAKCAAQEEIKKSSLWGFTQKHLKLNFKKSPNMLENVDPNSINEYYCTMGFPPGDLVRNTLNTEVEAAKPFNDNQFYVKTVTHSELFLAWKKLRKKLSKKEDTTGISKYFLDLAMGLPSVQNMILRIVNESFSSGCVPFTLKMARVVPIPKVEGAIEPSQFRPIAITSNILLLMEKIYYGKLISCLQDKAILSDKQFGCRRNHSTELAMIAVTDIAMRYIDKGFFAVVVSIDLRKAFDSVHREKLLEKLINKYGISDYWLRSYLADRKQSVDVNGKISTVRDVLVGLPAGGVLSPILFALFLNDLPTVVLNGTTVMFVDDSNFVFCGKHNDLKSTENVINDDMARVVRYFESNSLVINSDKTKMLTISSSRKASSLDEFTFEIAGFKVHNGDKLKCLGLTLDRKMNWTCQIENASKVCFIRLRALYLIRDFFTKDQLKVLCQSFILSIVNYMIVVYGVAKKVNMKILIGVVRTLARLVLRIRKYDPVSQMIVNDLEWLLPIELCEYKTLCLMYKICNNEERSFFTDYFVRTSSQRRPYDYACKLTPKNDIGKNSFEFRAVFLWNRLPVEVKQCESLKQFKKKAKEFLLKRCLENK